MKFVDDSQNLRVRLRLIQALVLVILGVLCVRLYLLQIIDGKRYGEIAENQRIRLLPIPAPRGGIFDRTGTIALVSSRPIYSVILSREDTKGIDRYSLIKPLAEGLGLDPELLREKFDEVKSQPAFESILIKEGATQADIVWVDAHQLEFPALRVEQTPQRRYPANGQLAHVLGYVGEISPEQLKQEEYRDKGYRPGDIIGQEGLEKVYDEYLRGRDGYRKVIVDSRGHIQNEVERVEPQSGQDIVTTIDLDLQEAAEDQLRKSPQGRGVIIAMDPNNGEIFALASAPTFDPNLFSQRITTKEGRAEYQKLLNDPDHPLINRAIQGKYPPGSTWKPLMATAGLKQGAISIDNSNLVCGGGITIGNKFTRCMGGNHGSPNVHVAIEKSCDSYFYHLGLKMKLEGIQQMVNEFELDKRTGIDLPHEVISTTPSPEQNAVVVQAMWAVVNEAGTATGIKMAGFDIAGKTGTAQVVSLGKEGSEHRDHSWFVSYAPAFKPEISCVAMIENAGLGSRFGAPSVRAIYDVYYQKHYGQQTKPKENIALKVR